ncbi:MAG: succinate dehydrogenase, cytochrome b556 subunit [Leptothrix ochracea]|uniref:succinate dehydrogenase, cytochrome b556 subunit n=1 Tax=Leptothrix ochracea TaxID=735331 RepID=UPI0034E2589F
MADTSKRQRPVFRNINIFDLRHYRLPLAGIVSILHRVSGAMMFLLMPFIVWMFDTTLTSEVSFAQFSHAFEGFFVKLICFALTWAYLLHFIAGVRHLWMDLTHSVSKEQGQSSAIVTLALSLGLTVVLGAKLFGLI